MARMADRYPETDRELSLPADQVPGIVGSILLASAEVRIYAEMVMRVEANGPTFDQAKMLAHNAMRLGSWATMASACPVRAEAPPLPVAVTVYVPPGLHWRARWRAAWGVWWRVVRGTP